MKTYYGVSMGETGDYGVGDIVEGTEVKSQGDTLYLNGEPVYNVFTIENGKVKYVDL